ncbi:MAG: CidA/LrgA family protein [Candidatus Ventricola sp.]
MNILRQFSIILLISLIGEALSYLVPLPIPSSIYGIVLLFLLLCTDALRVESIREASSFLIAVMPVMFIPAGVGLMASFGLLLPALPAYTVITVVSTVAVMAVAGRAAQAVIRRSSGEESRHA